jgi:hypothetical protein
MPSPRPLLLAACTLLAACGYSQDRYADDMIELTCAKFAECDMLDFFGGTEEACQNYQQSFYQGVEDDSETCPNYDSKAARDCADAWEDITCAELEDGQTPAICSSVCTAGSGAED